MSAHVEVTWGEIAAAYPTAVQEYVQKFGPLPDGPITPEAWDRFRAGECVTPPEEGA